MADDPERETDLSAGKSLSVPTAVGAGIIAAGATVAGLVNPILGVVAGGLAPFITLQMEDIIRQRLLFLKQKLDENDVNLEQLSERPNVSREKLLLLQEAIASALGSDHNEKVSLIVRLLKIGIDSDVEADVIAARRFARTVSRLDEVELRLIIALHDFRARGADAGIRELTAATRLGNPDLVRSAISVLQAEGLVREQGKVVESWTITDFGMRLVAELVQVFVGGSNEDATS